MAKKTSLMEWLDQTRKLSKEEDYMGLAIVDTLMDYVWLVDQSSFAKHKKEVSRLCEQYHKPNPFEFFGNRKKIEAEFRRQNNGKTYSAWFRARCRLKAEHVGDCGVLRFLKGVVTEQILLQLDRYERARLVLLFQWFEVIDFMFERPELVDPDAIDGYVGETIYRVCRDNRKNNPLSNGVKKRFGKFWKDKDGKWHKERRRRT